MRVVSTIGTLGVVIVALGLPICFFSTSPAEAPVVSTVAAAAPVSGPVAAVAKLQAQMKSGEGDVSPTAATQTEQHQLKELAARLQALENRPGPDQAAEPEKSLTDETRITEAEVEQWIDRSLDFIDFDAEATESARATARHSLSNNPDILLDDMQCGEGVCRAAFTHVNGSQPDVAKLFGAPPFTGEGFTVTKPDGRVMIYFAEDGKSLEAIRQQLADVSSSP